MRKKPSVKQMNNADTIKYVGYSNPINFKQLVKSNNASFKKRSQKGCMRCSICHNGVCKKGLTTQTFGKNGVITVFKNVPALICNNCDMKFFDVLTSSELLKRAKEVRRSGAELEIINMAA